MDDDSAIKRLCGAVIGVVHDRAELVYLIGRGGDGVIQHEPANAF